MHSRIIISRYITCHRWYFWWLLLFVFLAHHAPAQAGTRDAEAGRRNIMKLKDGVVLVRLHNYTHRIELLKERGYSKEAEILQKQSEERNRTIILAFRENFHFARIYFFYANESQLIKNRQFSEVHWIGESPQITSDSTYFIAEINMLDKSNQHGGELSFEALVLRDCEFIQLRRPFPYYARTFGSLPGMRDMPTVIHKMNTKLVKYHKETLVYLEQERVYHMRKERWREERELRQQQRKQLIAHRKKMKAQKKNFRLQDH